MKEIYTVDGLLNSQARWRSEKISYSKYVKCVHVHVDVRMGVYNMQVRENH